MRIDICLVVSFLAAAVSAAAAERTDDDRAVEAWRAGDFRWTASQPLVEVIPENLPASPDNAWHAVKDPSIVRHQCRWHLFCTLRKQQGGDGKPPGSACTGRGPEPPRLSGPTRVAA